MELAQNKPFHKFNICEYPKWLNITDYEANPSIFKKLRINDLNEAIKIFQNSIGCLLTFEKHWDAVVAAKEAIHLKNKFGRREIVQVIIERLRLEAETIDHRMTIFYLIHLILLIDKYHTKCGEMLFLSAFSEVNLSETYFDIIKMAGCEIRRKQLDDLMEWFKSHPFTNVFAEIPHQYLIKPYDLNSLMAPTQADNKKKPKNKRKAKKKKEKLMESRRIAEQNRNAEKDQTKISIPEVNCLFPNLNAANHFFCPKIGRGTCPLCPSSRVQKDLLVVSPGGITLTTQAVITIPSKETLNPQVNTVVTPKRPNELMANEFCQTQNVTQDDLCLSTPNKLITYSNPEVIRNVESQITLALSPALNTKSVSSKTFNIPDESCQLNIPVNGQLPSHSITPPAITSPISRNAFENHFPNVSKVVNDQLMKELITTKADKVLSKNNDNFTTLSEEIKQPLGISTPKLKNPNDLNIVLDNSVTKSNLKEAQSVSQNPKPQFFSPQESFRSSLTKISHKTTPEQSKFENKIAPSNQNQITESICTDSVSKTRKNDFCNSKESEVSLQSVNETKTPAESEQPSKCNVDTSIGTTSAPPKEKDLAMMKLISEQDREVVKNFCNNKCDTNKSECSEDRNETGPGGTQHFGDKTIIEKQSPALTLQPPKNNNGPGGVTVQFPTLLRIGTSLPIGKRYVPPKVKRLSMLLLQKDREMGSGKGNSSDSSDLIQAECYDARNKTGPGLTQQTGDETVDKQSHKLTLQPPGHINGPSGIDGQFPTESLIGSLLPKKKPVILSNMNHPSGITMPPPEAYIPEIDSLLIKPQLPPYEFLINTYGFPSRLAVVDNKKELKRYSNSNECNDASHLVENSSYANRPLTLPPLPPPECLKTVVLNTSVNPDDVEEKKAALKLLINPDVNKSAWKLCVPGMELIIVKTFGNKGDLCRCLLHPDLVLWEHYVPDLELFFYRSGNI